MTITNMITLITEFPSNISWVCIFVDARCTANIWRVSGGQHRGSSKKDEPFWTHKIKSVNDIWKIQERERTRSEVTYLGLVDFCRSMCLLVLFFGRKILIPYPHFASNLWILKLGKMSDFLKVCGALWRPSGESFRRTSHWATKQFLSSFIFIWSEHWCYITFVKKKPNTRITKCESEENTLNTFETMQCTIYSKLLLDNKNMIEGADALVNRKWCFNYTFH